MPLNKKNYIIALEAEGTAGTAETLLAADAAFNASNVSFAPIQGVTQRQGQGSMSQNVAIPEGRSGTLSFDFELYTNAAWVADLMPALGWYNGGSGTSWSPTSVSAEWHTVTAGYYIDGVLHRLAGCMGTAALIFEKNKPTIVRVTLTGIGVAPSDTALLSPTYPLTVAAAPAWNSATMTIGSFSPQVNNMQIDLNNEVELIPDQDAAEGYARAWIGNRRIAGTINPIAELLAAHNPYSIRNAGTEEAFSNAYADMAITMPKFQITDIGHGGNNVLVHDLGWQANKSASAGDDEIVIDFDTTD